MKKAMFFSVLYLLGIFQSFGQEVFTLKNPSFEKDEPAAGVIPEGWLNMGAPNETPPDIQPGMFEVNLKAQDGKVYLGLVTRDNNTWEGVGQLLDGYLQKDSSYMFSLYLARSNSFISMSKATLQEATYNAPTILKIWGVNSQTGQDELLAESEPVSHSQWTNYTFTLKPTVADFDEIDLMAYYAPGFEQKNGNLLIDNCSAIIKDKK
ncbi:MAG TPA: hypothetical protein PK228_07170 [Saprospiraceae bacterium]|nr:hypothetical protein [Saprospiraceae bacterium]